MRALSATELLTVWERGTGLTSIARAELLLRCASEPGNDVEPAELSLGERDSRLLTLREWAFGPDVAATSRCPKCGTEVEVNFQVGDIRVPEGERISAQSFSSDGYCVDFRVPTCRDLRVVTADRSSESALRRRLVHQCVSRAQRGGEEIAVETLPESVVESLSSKMSELDPQAEIDMGMTCESCGERWNEWFDVESFFWTEIQVWVARLLEEVHQLAASYGWAESAILAMSPMRRSLYLNLITG